MEAVQVYPPRVHKGVGSAQQGTDPDPSQGRRGQSGTIFTMLPASARLFIERMRTNQQVENVRRAGWSVRLHLPLVQYRCKCALYNEHRHELQGKKFGYTDQYTTLRVQDGPVFKLSPVQLKAIVNQARSA